MDLTPHQNMHMTGYKKFVNGHIQTLNAATPFTETWKDLWDL